MRVLSIQSHVVYGYVGNKAATFPLQLLGFEVDPLNTVTLSNHTQYKNCTGTRLEKDGLLELSKGLISNGFIQEYSHVLTGYLGNPGTIDATIEIIHKIKQVNPNLTILVDPVMGDDGRLYVSEQLVARYPALIQMASIITPNGFEAQTLSGIKVDRSSVKQVFEKLHAMGPATVVITSVLENGKCFLYGSNKSIQFQLEIELIHQHFTGTGDLFSALLLANLVKYPLPQACEKSVDSIHGILSRTLEIRKTGCELALVQSANLILNPPKQCNNCVMNI